MDHSSFVPHGYCLLWNARLIWLTVLSDAVVALSYYSIPFALFLVAARRREHVPQRPLLLLFGLFILFCGGGHAIDILSIWRPIYWTKAWWNVGTALFSGLTALIIIPRSLSFLKLPETKKKLERETLSLEGENRLLRAVLDSVSDAIVLVGPAGEFEVIGEAAQRLAQSRSLDLKSLCSSSDPGHPVREVVRTPGNAFIERFQTTVPGYGRLFVLRDITDSESATQRLRELASIVEGSDDAILTKSLDGLILTWNKGAERMYGYSADDMIGKPISLLTPASRLDELEAGMSQLREGQHIDRFETVRVRKDGEEINVSLSLSPILDASGDVQVISIIARDITPEKRYEEHLRRSLKEKEVMLKEIHHRVKNNLQVVGSLLYLQSGYIENEADRRRLQECRNRVNAMALVHEKLCRAEDLASVELRHYVEELATHLCSAWAVDTNSVHIHIDIEDIRLTVEKAVPCSLILNELISNAFKYAFAGREEGELRVWCHRVFPGTVTMIVSDDGVGYHPAADGKHPRSLGLDLVDSLAEQLDARVSVKSGPGTEFAFSFPEF